MKSIFGICGNAFVSRYWIKEFWLWSMKEVHTFGKLIKNISTFQLNKTVAFRGKHVTL